MDDDMDTIGAYLNLMLDAEEAVNAGDRETGLLLWLIAGESAEDFERRFDYDV